MSIVDVTMAAPVLGEKPETAAQVETGTNNPNYTVSAVEWHEALTSAAHFKAEETYTATVTLTSKNNEVFQVGGFIPTVTNAASVGTSTTLNEGVGIK